MRRLDVSLRVMRVMRGVPVIACLASIAALGAEPTPQRFAAPIDVQTSAPFVELALPPSAYAHSLQRGLRDLRIVDSLGERVPFAVLGAPVPLPASERLRAATLYPLPPRPVDGSAWPSPLEVTVQGDRISVRRNGPAAPSAASMGTAVAPAKLVPGWLFDLGEARPGDTPAKQLRLHWSGPAEFSAGYAIDTSDDLRQWRAAGSGQLMALRSASGSLDQPLVALPSGSGRFVRLVWVSPADAPMVDAAVAVAPAPERLVADAASELVLAPMPSPTPPPDKAADPQAARALDFDLGGELPVVDLDLRFAGGTRIAPARLLGRSKPDESWRDLGGGVFYRLERNGVVSESPAVAMPASLRFVRVLPDERAAALVAGSTRLVAHVQFAHLVFATSGSAPYSLQAGSIDAAEGALPIASLVPDLDAERGRFGRATLGAFSEIAAAAAVADRSAQVARWRPWLLWSVLLVGVIGLGALVVRLARQGPAAGPER